MDGGRGSGAEQHAFARDALVLRVETGGELRAVLVQQERIFESAAREESFGEAGQKDDVEAASARFFDGTDEDTAVAALGRLGAQEAEAFGEDVVDFVERSRADFAHGLQFAQDAEDRFGTAERHLSEVGEAIEPDAPAFGGGKRAENVQSREGRNVPNVLAAGCGARCARDGSGLLVPDRAAGPGTRRADHAGGAPSGRGHR